ncbi:MAG TPA: dihydrolipoyl dehydrogenase [Kiritimatiellia bacterium]|nr:dihydrolipoyl dehydrogenase [Kiritimatiellia bacterium]HOR96824.1 dihydrolipoyl dehydrogenase [Kiritimatiellia bacterium]HRU19363.1 dihydrolipoyl dehydrogenase [Kiritimatiellia bacterium]
MQDFDIIVIGAGPGGYPAAIRAAQLGKKTAIIEKEALGGTCLNWGCIPTKTLIASAERYHHATQSATFGVTAKGVTFDYAAMTARKAEIVDKLSGGVRMLLQSNGVELINGTARFEGPNRLSVLQPDGTTRWLSAVSIIIAAGSDSAMPAFLPKDKRVMDSRAFLDLTELPKKLLILGGGVIGCEFACMAAALGADVTVVEMLEDIVTVLDRDVRRVLRKRMETLGITLLTGTPLTDIAVKKNKVTGTFKDQRVEGDVLLVAVGRKPNTALLDLARAGIKTDERGTIPVNAQGRTNVASVFAVGDLVTGSIQLAHAATQQGVTAAEAAAGLKSKVERICPACIFTSPEIGLAGLTENMARQRGIAVKTAVFPFSALGKAMTAGETDGFVKWVCDPVTGQVLGAQAVGCHATELIAEAALAIRNELTVHEIGNTIHCHPTLSEAWMEAAHAFHDACIHLPKR